MRLIDADALDEKCGEWYVEEGPAEGFIGTLRQLLASQPTAQPTIYGYNVEHLELIARILQKENMPPERVLEVLTDIGRIVAIISDEFRETLRKSVEQCLYCADAERRTDE